MMMPPLERQSTTVFICLIWGFLGCISNCIKIYFRQISTLWADYHSIKAMPLFWATPGDYIYKKTLYNMHFAYYFYFLQRNKNGFASCFQVHPEPLIQSHSITPVQSWIILFKYLVFINNARTSETRTTPTEFVYHILMDQCDWKV